MDQEQIQSLINRMCNGEQVQAWEIGYLKNDAGKPDVQAALLHVLQNDKEKDVRRKAAEVLAPHVESGACNVESTPVKDALLHVLQNDEDWYVRTIVAKALKPHVESGACNGESTPVKAALLNVLQNDTDGSVRSAAAEALKLHVESGACNEESTPVQAAFVYALQNDTDGSVRYIAAKALKPHVESGACNGESTPVKAAFVYALQNDVEADVLKVVDNVLESYRDDPVVQEAFELFVNRLVGLLQDDNKSTMAASVLELHADVPAVEKAFCDILNDHDNPPDLLEVVANGLKRCPDRPAVQAAFCGVLEDQEWVVEYATGGWSHGWPAVANRMTTHVCTTAVHVLADHAWEVEAVPDLLCKTMQRHPYSFIREVTAGALKPHVSKPTVKAAFCDVLVNDPLKQLRYEAYQVLQPYQREVRVQNACFAALERELRPQR
jgi:hypothetical protein